MKRVNRRIKKHANVRITLENQQILVGRLLACDEVMNTLVENTTEFKWSRVKRKWQRRPLGFCIIRGSSISYLSLEEIL